MKLKKTSNKPVPEAKSKRKQRPASPLMLALLPALTGVLAAAALLVQLYQTSTAEQNHRQIQNLASTYNQQLDLLLGMTERNSQTLSTSPSLQNAILLRDKPALERLAREWSQIPYVMQAVIMTPGDKADPSLGFAAQDHLGVAATSQRSTLEYAVTDGQQLFYQASPVLHPEQNRVIGTLLLAYDAKTILDSLPQPDLTGSWQIRLQQQLPQAPQIGLYQAGPGLQTSTAQTFATAHPNWTLSVGVDSPELLASPLFAQYLAVPLVALLGALAALLLMHNRQRKLLAREAATLHAAISTLQPQRLDALTSTELQTLTKPLQKLLHKSASAAPVIQPTPATTSLQEQPPAGPTPDFMLNDVLDIDILDLDIEEQSGLPTPSSHVDPSIFRAYDIRGIVGTNLNADTAYWIGRAVGSESIACGESKVVVGRDGRLSGPQLLEALTRGLTESGCTVLDLGMVPTPLVYFGTHQLEATSGVMVTGSHNPPDYNGFKIVIAGETLASERITALYQRIASQELTNGSGPVQQVDLLDQYITYITDDIAIGNSLKVVVDCGNGVAGVVAPRLLESIGCTVIPLYCEVDGTFPNHHPDPGKPENLQDLIHKVREEGADLGLAFDGDGDRLGVVTNTGEIIYPDRLMMLLAKDVVSRNPGCDIIYDVKCSRRLSSLISRCGGRPVMWKTGHSLMKAKLYETGALLAGEMSGHIFFKERWFGFDDGVYAAARLLEILSLDNDSVDRVFARYPVSPSTPELTIEVTEDSKFAIIDALQASASWGEGSINTLDGIRVDYPQGWGLIRASNTTPMLVLRFEGDTKNDLQHIQTLFRDRLLAVAPDIHWPF